VRRLDERHRNTLLGAFVVLIVVLFVAGVMRASAVREWLNPSKTLHLVLPEEGLHGLSEGAEVEILGTPAGYIAKIVINPQQRIRALVKIKASMAPFVRRDSKAIIRKTFGVVGETYVEITSGHGEKMDWHYAVLDAEADRAPTQSIGEIMEDVRRRMTPILEQTERTMTALAKLTEALADPKGNLQVTLGHIRAVTGRIEQGQGSLGRMLTNDAAARELEALLDHANRTVAALAPILASLDHVMHDLRATSPQLPRITRDIRGATASAPVLMGTIQQTLAELETVLRKLRSSWLLGGGTPPPAVDNRLPMREIRP
jgi:phospholipid/cholesterol/gamma-HCH transport system substrate-binding protein